MTIELRELEVAVLRHAFRPISSAEFEESQCDALLQAHRERGHLTIVRDKAVDEFLSHVERVRT